MVCDIEHPYSKPKPGLSNPHAEKGLEVHWSEVNGPMGFTPNRPSATNPKSRSAFLYPCRSGQPVFYHS